MMDDQTAAKDRLHLSQLITIQLITEYGVRKLVVTISALLRDQRLDLFTSVLMRL